jgi:hypothetical protein
MDDDEELKAQCYGGEYMSEVFDHLLKRMSYRSRFYESPFRLKICQDEYSFWNYGQNFIPKNCWVIGYLKIIDICFVFLLHLQPFFQSSFLIHHLDDRGYGSVLCPEQFY